MEDNVPLVAVIGAGFAGVKVVKGLRKTRCKVVLVDRHNYHLFQPLLYQVATAALSPADIAYPIRRIFRSQKNVAVALGHVERVDLENNTFGGDQATMKFDYLVLAVGATHSYFGHDDWKTLAPGLKTIDDATELRKRMLLAFEEAEYESDPVAMKSQLTFVIIGGGPTGVEMAGAIRDIAVNDMPKDFRAIDTTMAHVILLQGGDRLLPLFPKKLSDRAKSDLESLGVDVRLNARVTKVDEDGVWIGDQQLRANNIMWAAGVQAPPLLKSLGVETDKTGRVMVQPDLSVPGHPNVFVIGDAADVKDAKTGEPVPGLAPAAMQMGEFVAKLLRNEIGTTPKPPRPTFEYWDKGTMATIGKRRAVANIKGLKFGGAFAWFLWGVIHLSFLVSFRNRFWVMLSWLYEYFTHGREARLITGDVKVKIQKVRTDNMPMP